MATAAQVNERLAALTEAGTSVWLDQIRRSLIESGRAAAPGRRGLAARRDLQPGDLREGDPRLRRLRRATSRSWPARASTPTRSTSTSRSRTCRWPATCCAPSGTRRGGADGFVSLEVEPALALRHRRHARSRRASSGSAVDRPNVMIKIPGTDEGAAGDRGGDRRGHQRQRHAAVLGRGLRGGRRGLHPRPRAPPRGGRVARRALRGELLRLARGHRGRQAPRGARPRGPPGQGRASPTRAPPTCASRRSSTASASPSCARPGAPVQRPLWASTGVKNPEYPETKYVDELVAPDTVNTMPMATLLAAAEQREISGATADQDPTRRPRGAGRGGHRHGRRDRQAAARRHRRVRRRRSTS